jgi:hypothetical protein
MCKFKQKRAAATRKPGQSHQQSFAKVCETPDGFAIYRASQAAPHEQPDYVTNFAKGAAEHAGTADTATERLSRICIELTVVELRCRRSIRARQSCSARSARQTSLVGGHRR